MEIKYKYHGEIPSLDCAEKTEGAVYKVGKDYFAYRDGKFDTYNDIFEIDKILAIPLELHLDMDKVRDEGLIRMYQEGFNEDETRGQDFLKGFITGCEWLFKKLNEKQV